VKAVFKLGKPGLILAMLVLGSLYRTRLEIDCQVLETSVLENENKCYIQSGSFIQSRELQSIK